MTSSYIRVLKELTVSPQCIHASKSRELLANLRKRKKEGGRVRKIKLVWSLGEERKRKKLVSAYSITLSLISAKANPYASSLCV